ncbi:MAG: Y-family DNA polymerase [Bacteroidaceae bacterium]|nr:Y-family DNA polymerase [Bacteroidaceae bacterium]
MYALVDCNSFFCAVEKVFHPGLSGKPVCVLSSNDGCVVALTPEAKALGIRRGDPVFKVKDIVERNDVRVFSGNMRLYAAMSRRIVQILRKSVEKVENYSIDESFCCLDGYERLYDLAEFMRGIARKIALYTDIPVSVGIAPTKTLAKAGSLFAKRYAGYRDVCMIDTEEKRRKALSMLSLADIWGIGRRTREKLSLYGVESPLAFADKSASWVKSHLQKNGYCTWLELNSVPCIDTSEVVRNQSICTSHSFARNVEDLPSLKASVASFAFSGANKLRAQQAMASSVTVFLGSNRFRDDLEQYENADTAFFITPTSDSLEITSSALQILERLYKPGIQYKKTGVVLGCIGPSDSVQQDLFDSIPNRPQRMALMKAIDALNCRYGPKTVSLVVEDNQKRDWHVKSEFRSPDYLTNINEILTVKI